MNSILFNTSKWAPALLSCIAQAKCHDPRGTRDSIASGELTGSRGAADLWSKVHHPTSYSVTETWGGCCNPDVTQLPSMLMHCADRLCREAHILSHCIDTLIAVFFPSSFTFFTFTSTEKQNHSVLLPTILLQHVHALLLLAPYSLSRKEYSLKKQPCLHNWNTENTQKYMLMHPQIHKTPYAERMLQAYTTWSGWAALVFQRS